MVLPFEKTWLICIHNFNGRLPLPKVGLEEKLPNHVKVARHIGSGDEQDFGIGSSFRRSSEQFCVMPLLTGIACDRIQVSVSGYLGNGY
ncbi:hypothetical protein CEXT_789431 [Caerostris extrusa]|uniref:Uncharacterized protein n=1 Tax=Caerostris extrusa TaxID=172846 RepID=A0AAV4XL65_CAEEX|nr:hypothetical protein CEXT_789431 [Caerostris extrusa]